MMLEFRKPTENDSKEISTWKYDGIYSFYDNDKTKTKQEWALNIHKDENAFMIYKENELIANCCFNFDKDKILFGIQMKPNLTGKGMGTDIVNAALNFGREKFKFNNIWIFVAKFNNRAIKIYKKLGFKITYEFVWKVNGEETGFIEMQKSWNEV